MPRHTPHAALCCAVPQWALDNYAWTDTRNGELCSMISPGFIPVFYNNFFLDGWVEATGACGAGSGF